MLLNGPNNRPKSRGGGGSSNAMSARNQRAFDILLRFILDKESYQKVKEAPAQLAVELDKVGQSTDRVRKAAEKLGPKLDEQEKQAAKLQQQWWRTQRELRAAQFVFTSIGAVDAAILVPLVKTATDWASEMEKAGATNDKVYNAWAASQKKIKDAQLEIGRAVAEALLPAMEKLAELSTKGAAFIDQHPDLIKIALGAGAALVSIAAIGTLLTQGIKLIVDAKFVLAASQNMLASEMMLTASENNLLAAGIATKGGIGKIVTEDIKGGLTVLLAKIGPLGVALATLTTVVVAASAAIDGIAKIGAPTLKKVLGQDYKDTLDPFLNLKQMIAANIIGRNQGNVNQGFMTQERADKIAADTKAFLGLTEAIDNNKESVQSAADALAEATRNAEGVKILAKLSDDLVKMAQKYADDRVKIEEGLVSDLAAADRKLQDKLADISTNLDRNLVKLAEDYALQQQKAAEDEAFREQEVLIKSNEEIVKLRKDHQRRLEEIERDHLLRQWDLAMANDALGLVLERRRYENEKRKENESFTDQTAEKRRQAQQQIAEMRRQFALEQMQRRRDYEYRIAEARLNAQQAAEDAQLQHTQEIQQAKDNAKDRLAELQREYDEERKQKILAAYQDIVALGGALRAEQEFKRLYYEYMLQDAQAFVEAYRAALAQIASQGSTSNPGEVPPTHEVGGYTKAGLARLHSNEYVLSPGTTRAAEQLVGQQLTQQGILAALAGGGRGSVTVNDHRRFDSRLTPEDRHMIEKWTMEMFEGMLS